MNENRVRWDGDKMVRKVDEGTVRALFVGGEHILHKANETVPYLEGILAGSGNTSVDRNDPKAFISYDTPYAVKQHEDVTLRHSGRRRAKWLQLTMQEQSKNVVEIMARELRKVVK